MPAASNASANAPPGHAVSRSASADHCHPPVSRRPDPPTSAEHGRRSVTARAAHWVVGPIGDRIGSQVEPGATPTRRRPPVGSAKDAPTESPPWSVPRLNQKIVVGTVFVSAMFMNIMDITIVNVALPTIGRDFHIAPTAVDGIVIAYLVSLAVFIPASGWLGDRFGGKRVLLIAIAVFTVGSVLCGLAQNMTELVVFRVLQGAGGGMMAPVGMAMLYRVFPPAERVRAASILTVPTTLAPALGPVLGGFLVTSLTLALGLLRQPADRHRRHRLRRAVPRAHGRPSTPGGSTCPGSSWAAPVSGCSCTACRRARWSRGPRPRSSRPVWPASLLLAVFVVGRTAHAPAAGRPAAAHGAAVPLDQRRDVPRRGGLPGHALPRSPLLPGRPRHCPRCSRGSRPSPKRSAS